MAIKKYTATKDNTITNAFKQNLITRGTGSNMGASDVTEIFSIYGQALVQGTTTDAGKQTQDNKERTQIELRKCIAFCAPGLHRG